MTQDEATRIRETITRYFAAIGARDAEVWVGTFAPDAVAHDPAGSPPMRGHEALRRHFLDFLGRFTTFALTADEVYMVGRRAAVHWHGGGRATTGRVVTFQGIDIFDFDEQARIVELQAFWDVPAFMKQLQE